MKKLITVVFLFSLFAAEFAWAASCNSNSNFKKYLSAYVGSSGSNYCWFCDMFEGLFDAMNNLATAISVNMAEIFLMIMGVGLLFSIAFKVAKMVTSMQGADVMQFLTDMFKHLGRAIIATALLVSSLSIFTYLVSPVLSMSMSLSAIIIDEGGGRSAVIKATQNTGINTGSICDDLTSQIQSEVSVSEQTKAFTDDVKASFVCALRTMSAGMIFGMALGATIWGLTFSNMLWGVVPNIEFAILGTIIILGHLAILITFPFKLIDSMIRMSFVTALMPLWIVLWVFPATVGYTKKAWDLFLSSCLIFVCLSVVMALVMNLMQYAIPNRDDIIKLLLCGYDKEAAKKMPIGGKSLLITMALTFLGWKMLGMATTLASSFVGAIPDLGVGQSINETTVKGAKLISKGGRAVGRKAANSKAGQWVKQKTGLDSQKAAKLGTLAAAGVATGGVVPALYGLGKGGMAGYRAMRNKFTGGGNGTVQGNTQASNASQGTGKTSNITQQSAGKTSNVTAQGAGKVPNVMSKGNVSDKSMQKTPNIPSPQPGKMPAGSWSSGKGTTTESMAFGMGGQSVAAGTSVTSGSLSSGGKSSETMSFNTGARTGGTVASTSTSSNVGASSETMSYKSSTGTTNSTPETSTSTSSGANTSSEAMTYAMGASNTDSPSNVPDSTPAEEPSHERTEAPDSTAAEESMLKQEEANRAEAQQRAQDDQKARDAAQKAAADAQKAAAQAAAAQAAVAQSLSEASKKDKDGE